MELQILHFAPEHVAAVAAIELECYPDPWSEHSFSESLILSDTSWVVMARDELAGYLLTQWVLDEIHILNIAVKPALREKGIATKLLTMLLRLASARGMRDIFLEVRISNLPAQKLYRRFGFTVLATRSRYYHDGEDALVMYRQLDSALNETEAALADHPGDGHGN